MFICKNNLIYKTWKYFSLCLHTTEALHTSICLHIALALHIARYISGHVARNHIQSMKCEECVDSLSATSRSQINFH